MTELFSEYINNIAFIVIFTSFTRLLVPEGSVKKYINMILGFLIIMAIIEPMKNIMFKDFDIELATFNVQSITENDVIVDGEIVQAKQEKIIKESVKAQLKKQIEEMLSENKEIAVRDIKLMLNADYSINSISVDVDRIGVDKQEIVIETYKQEDILKKDLQTLLSDFYKIEKDNINISVRLST